MKKIVIPHNTDKDGCANTLRANYFKMGGANFIGHTNDGFRATCIIEVLEMNENGTSNTLTSVQKDNLVVEPLCSVHPNSHKFEFNPATSVKPISPALRATDYKAPPCAWEPQVMAPKRTAFGKAVRKEYEKGNLTISRHEMTTMEPREDGVSNMLTSVQKDNLLCEPRYRIRKLTPRECFRLMGVDDKDIDTIQAAGISNSQQYKMAGNSIVVDVLYHQFVKAFIDHPSQPTNSLSKMR